MHFFKISVIQIIFCFISCLDFFSTVLHDVNSIQLYSAMVVIQMRKRGENAI